MTESKLHRVFISHNSAHNPESRAYLDRLIAALEEEKDESDNRVFDVLVDRYLEEGQLWRGPLYSWMLLCDSAVMLIDKDSPDTTWLPREAMIFGWRRQLDPSFFLLPVLLGINKSIFEKPAFRDMGIGDIDYVASADPAKIVQILKKRVPCSADRRLARMKDFLKRSGESALEDALGILALGPNWSFLTRFDKGGTVAATLIGLGFRKGPFRQDQPDHPSARALRALSDWLDGGHKRRILQDLGSYFVTAEIGADIFHATKQKKVIALRVSRGEISGWPDRFIKSHLVEAFSQNVAYQPTAVRIAPLTPANGMDDELTCIRNAIRRGVWPEGAAADGVWTVEHEERFQHRCAAGAALPEYFCWAMDRDPVRLETLVQVQQEMPYLRLIYLWTGEACPDHDAVYCLRKNLDPKDEKSALDETDTANSILRGWE